MSIDMQTAPGSTGAQAKSPATVGVDIAQLALSADGLIRHGRIVAAAGPVLEGINRLLKGESSQQVPRELLMAWGASDAKSLFVRMCMSVMGFSSYFNLDKSGQVLRLWMETEPGNPEPYLRYGLRSALLAIASGQAIPEGVLASLRHAHKKMGDERSAAAVALAEGGLEELSLPYDLGRIWLFPDLKNMSTYVLLEQNDWFEEDLRLFRSMVRPQDRILDLGCNVGTYSLSAAARTQSPGRVISVEPASDTFALVNRTAQPYEHWTALNAAVSDYEGEATFDTAKAPELRKLGQAGASGTQTVPVRTVDGLAEEHGIDAFDIVKMDVEGHEQATLNGGKKIFQDGSPVVFYEFREPGNTHSELMDVFEEMGYRNYYFVPGLPAVARHEKGYDPDPMTLNMIAVKPDNLERFAGVVRVLE